MCVVDRWGTYELHDVLWWPCSLKWRWKVWNWTNATTLPTSTLLTAGSEMQPGPIQTKLLGLQNAFLLLSSVTGTAAQTNEIPLLHTYIKNLCCPSPNSKVKNALANLGREAQGRSERNPVHESSKVDHFWLTGPRLCWPLALLIGNFGFFHFFGIFWPQSKIRCKMIVVYPG